jgi:hypothetical protein
LRPTSVTVCALLGWWLRLAGPHVKIELGRVAEDLLMQAAQPRSRLDAELGVQQAAGLLIGLQRLCLAAGPVQPAHSQTLQAFPVGMLLHQAGQPGGDGGMPSERQVRGYPILQRGQPHPVQPRTFPARDGHFQPVEDSSAPQR